MTDTTIDFFSRFNHIAKFNVDDIARGSYYVSKLSGMSVMIAEIDGPTIDAYICFGTKVDSNNGVAHTLEHMIFCGSKNYPYHGVLDCLANRCLAQGTNAWTAIDHTAYTISTASQQGLINILPVYMDHIFNPILSEESFSTEVYRINEAGEESGIVFSEMQAKENLIENKVYYAMMKRRYPGDNGYNYNSGGKLEDIRKINLYTIKKYHKKFYRPENTLVIVIGSITEAKILESLIKIEDTIICEHVYEPKLERPWANMPYISSEYGCEHITYPQKSLYSKLFQLNIMEMPREMIEESYSLSVIGSYLVYYPESPLRVQCIRNKHICSDVIYRINRENKICLEIEFINIDRKELNYAYETYCEIVCNIKKFGFKEDLLKTAIEYEYSYFANDFESKSHHILASKAIDYFLYGQDTVELLNSMNESRYYRDMINKPISYWISFFDKYASEKNIIAIFAHPSEENEDQLEDKSESQLEYEKPRNRRENLPPRDLIEQFQIPAVDDVKFYNINTLCNFGGFQFEDYTAQNFNVFNVPLAIQVDNIKTNSLTVTLCACLGKVTKELLPYLPLASCFPLEMPILSKGNILNRETVGNYLGSKFYHKISNIGWGSSDFDLGILSYYFFLSLTTDVFHYEEAVSWIRDLLFNYVCDLTLIMQTIRIHYNKTKSTMMDGREAAQGLSNMITYRDDTINYFQSVFVQAKHLQDLYQMCIEKPDEILKQFVNIQRYLRTKTNFQAHLICDLEKLQNICTHPHSIWQLNFSEYAAYDSHTPRTPSNFNYDQIENENFQHRIILLDSCDSSYLIQTLPSIRSYRDPDYPALVVLMEYLSAFEGPLWKGIRGKGLAYSCAIFAEPSDGLLFFRISKSSDIVRAYDCARKILKDFADGLTRITDSDVESAVSCTIFDFVRHESSAYDAACVRMISQLKGLDCEFHRELMKKVSKITASDMIRVAEKYLSPVVKHENSHIAISCPRSEYYKINSGFEDMGIELKIYEPPNLKNDLGNEKEAPKINIENKT